MTASTPARSSSSTSERLAPASSAIASLPGRDVGQELEQALEVILAVVRLLGGEQEDLGVDELEHLFELVLVAHADHALEAARDAPPRSRRRARRRARSTSTTSASTSPTSWPCPNASSGRCGAAPQAVVAAPDDEPLRPLLLGAPAPPPSATSTSTEIPSPSAIAWLSRRAPVTDRDATRSGRRRGGRAADAVGCARWPGPSSASACSVPNRPGRRRSRGRWPTAYDTVWNPEYGRPYTEIGRDPDAPWTSDEFTHIARIQCWYEDTPRPLGARGALLRHRRVHDGAVPPGLPRRADARVRRPARAALRPLPRLRARGAVEARRDQGVRGAAALDARAVPRAGAASGSPWVLARGAARRRGCRRARARSISCWCGRTATG